MLFRRLTVEGSRWSGQVPACSPLMDKDL